MGTEFQSGKMESSGGRCRGWMLILLSCALERGQMASVRHGAFDQYQKKEFLFRHDHRVSLKAKSFTSRWKLENAEHKEGQACPMGLKKRLEGSEPNSQSRKLS